MPFTPIPYPNGTGILELFTYPATVLQTVYGTGYIWGLLLVMIIWIILLTYIYYFIRVTRFAETLASASFITTIITGLLIVVKIVNDYIIIFPLVLTGIAGAILYLSKE